MAHAIAFSMASRPETRVTSGLALAAVATGAVGTTGAAGAALCSLGISV